MTQAHGPCPLADASGNASGAGRSAGGYPSTGVGPGQAVVAETGLTSDVASHRVPQEHEGVGREDEDGGDGGGDSGGSGVACGNDSVPVEDHSIPRLDGEDNGIRLCVICLSPTVCQC